MSEAIKVGKRRTVAQPAKIRRRSGIDAALVARARERAGLKEAAATKLAVEETRAERRR